MSETGDTIHLDRISESWGLVHSDDSLFSLIWTGERLELKKRDEPKLGRIFVDWIAGSVAHRRKFGGGKGQSIAKAVGLNKGVTPSILDATAGLGRDSFVFASLGCHVQMVERHPVVAALLDDGLKRASENTEIGAWVKERVELLHASSLETLTDLSLDDDYKKPDVVYLDPMYPHAENKKSALIKKEMRVFQHLVGSDSDADSLFKPALNLAGKRVVVKRPDYAIYLGNSEPTMSIKTKKNRFDVYVKAAMK